MDSREIENDLTEVLVTEQEIRDKLAELARRIEADYEGANCSSSASSRAPSWSWPTWRANCAPT
ncbi:hypothetical protein GCM10025870_24950 [Agromyces marinus]|uniref:Hypoxanthine phosphoribosyltransferase n=1 Tax=Agromyces marinus TaxID=1389020 RepID=A0ABM8H3N7_9MICO|nr:hypothetical protein GCM10025870_24950 [Agromyces marinus]